MFSFIKNCKQFLGVSVPSTFPPARSNDPSFLHPHCLECFYFSHSVSRALVSCGFNLSLCHDKWLWTSFHVVIWGSTFELFSFFWQFNSVCKWSFSQPSADLILTSFEDCLEGEVITWLAAAACSLHFLHMLLPVLTWPLADRYVYGPDRVCAVGWSHRNQGTKQASSFFFF